MFKKIINIPYKLRNNRLNTNFLNGGIGGGSNILNSSSSNSWLEQYFEYDNENDYLRVKKNFVSDYDITAYVNSGQILPTIFDNIPLASTTSKGLVQVGNNITVNNGVISVNDNAINPTLSFSSNILNVNGSNVNLSGLIPDLSNYAFKNGDANTDFSVNNLTVYGTVNHWLGDTITVADANLQLNRTQSGATVNSGLVIYDSDTSSIISNLNYNTNGIWNIDNNKIWHAGNVGSGSGLNADMLDGQHGSYYLPASTYNASDILTKLKTVDGAGSGLDADMLDGQHGSYFTDIVARLGFTPVNKAGDTGLKGMEYSTEYNEYMWRARANGPGARSDGTYLVFDRGTNTGANKNFMVSGFADILKDGNIVWNAANSNLSTVNWAAKNITAAGTVTTGIIELKNTFGDAWFHFRNSANVVKWGFSSDWDIGKLTLYDYTKGGPITQWAENGNIAFTPTGSVFIGYTADPTSGNKFAVNGNGYFNGSLTSTGQLISTIATGTAPLLVTSTTLVTNLNADLFDGQHGSYYLPASSYNASDILTKLKTVDGVGSGLDADMLDGQHGSYYYNPTNANLSTVDWAARNITASGNIKINKDSPSIYFNDTAGSTYSANIKYDNNILYYQWGGGTKFSIAYNGYTNTIGGYQINGTTVIDVSRNITAAGGTFSGNINAGGYITAAGEVTAYSDIRLKENVKSLESVINKIQLIKPVRFNKIGETDNKIGFIAQDLEKVYPEYVLDGTEYKSINYAGITAVLTKAIQEQQEQINSLKTEINNLRNSYNSH